MKNLHMMIIDSAQTAHTEPVVVVWIFFRRHMGGNLNLSDNQLRSIPADFGQLQVGGSLCLNSKQLHSLPEGFENSSVGEDLFLYGNQLVEQTNSFLNVQGEVYFEEDEY